MTWFIPVVGFVPLTAWAVHKASAPARFVGRQIARGARSWYRPQAQAATQDRRKLLDYDTPAGRSRAEAARREGRSEPNGWYTPPPGEPRRMAAVRLPENARSWDRVQRQFAAREDFARKLQQYAMNPERGGTAWNGGISIPDPNPPGGGPPGLAGPGTDGTMYVAQADIEQLERMHAKAGKFQTTKTKRLHKLAVAQVHESQVAFRMWDGNHADVHRDPTRPSVEVWQHGLTKTIAGRELNGFIRETGLNKITRGLDKVNVVDADPLYAPAIDRIAGDLAKLTGSTKDEVLQELSQEPNGEPWKAAADIRMRQLGGPDAPQSLDVLLSDEDERRGVHDAIAETYRTRLDDLGRADTSGMSRGEIKRMSANTGKQVSGDVNKLVKDVTKSRDRQARQPQQHVSQDQGRVWGGSQSQTNVSRDGVHNPQRDPALAPPQIVVDALGRAHAPDEHGNLQEVPPAARANRMPWSRNGGGRTGPGS